MKYAAALLLLTSVATQTRASVYKVTNTLDSGAGSLRQALADAAANPGPDTVTFGRLLSDTIEPDSELYVSDATTIDGDLGNDGAPDVALSGAKRTSGSAGLVVSGPDCIIDGLAFILQSPAGVTASYQTGCVVRSCYFGLKLDRTTEAHNLYDIAVYDVSGFTIGQPGKGNVFAANQTGVYMIGAADSVIQDNRFGTTAAGNEALSAPFCGILLHGTPGGASGSIIRGNVFGAIQQGVILGDTHGNVIVGNLFGLGADGTTPLPVTMYGILVGDGCTANRIGGGTAAARNVFVGIPTASGVMFDGTVATTANTIAGNYFGTNAAGDAQRTLGIGVACVEGAYGGVGSQTIGGTTAGLGNYFAPSGAAGVYGCLLDSGGQGSTIRHNTFGLLPNGVGASGGWAGVYAHDAGGLKIRDNLIARYARGIDLQDGAGADIYTNTFRNCGRAVYLSGAAVGRLGNLSNASTGDDGGNLFRSSNAW